MAKLSTIMGTAFDSSAVEPSEARDGAPLPAGLYTTEITGAEVRELSKKNGHGLTIEYTVADPEAHAKRKVWQLLCIVHENEQTQQIAQSQLSALCRAVGINGVLDDTDTLFGRMVRIRTKIRPAQGEYGPKAEVAGFEAVGTGAPTATRQAAAPAQAKATAPAQAKATAPWARKAA